MGINEKAYDRCRREYGGLKLDHAKRMKELEAENSRRKRIVANHAIDMAILRRAANRRVRSRCADTDRSIMSSIA